MPILDHKSDDYNLMLTNENIFKNYYDGLISYFSVSYNDSSYPKRNFIVELLESNDVKNLLSDKKNSFFILERNQGVKQKIKWIIDFLDKNKDQKTLIYSQFIYRSLISDDEAIPLLFSKLKNNGYKLVNKSIDNIDEHQKYFGYISGSLTLVEKIKIVDLYNKGVIKVLIFTLSIKEGISFRETNNIIVFQPYWNFAIMNQILARGIRFDSHIMKNKSVINLHLLCAVKNKNKLIDWKNDVENVFNNNVENLHLPIKQIKKKVGKTMIDVYMAEGYLSKYDNLPFSRDVNLYNRVIDKQGVINDFRRKLEKVNNFERSNNIENNDFVRDYNKKLIELEKEGTKLTLKLKRKLRNDMYNDYYKKEIEKVASNKGFVRFEDDTKFRVNVKPDLVAQQNYQNISDDELRYMIHKKVNLSTILDKFGIGKSDITNFQANFTPSRIVNFVIDYSDIKNDTRTNINILEPTAGVGNFIDGLLQLKNNEHFFIDCNEFNNAFYRIGKIRYENIDTIKWYNFDFFDYIARQSYEYIIGNPPFNLNLSRKYVVRQQKEAVYDPVTKKFYKVEEKQLFDVNFVERAYNMLANDGILCMIISDRYLRDETIPVFKKFRDNLKAFENVNGSYKYSYTHHFTEEKDVTKEMTTKFGMVCIRLVKIPNFNIEL